MKILGLFLGLFLISSVPSIAQTVPPPPVVNQTQAFGFDYSNTDLASGQVVRFERRIGSQGVWVDIQIPPIANDANTTVGSQTYRTPIPALTPGQHEVQFRACNVNVCSDASTAFRFDLIIKPVTTGNTRILGGG